MGAVCCCFNTRDPEDDVSSTRPNCFCPNCIIHTLLNKYTAIFNKDQSDAASTSTAQVIDPLSSDSAASNNIQSNNKSSGVLQCESTALSSASQPKFSYVAEHDEEEDVCPTCLEAEYIPDNPKIVLKCSHGYHLSCIYEWMERSEKCPICDRMMIFDEET